MIQEFIKYDNTMTFIEFKIRNSQNAMGQRPHRRFECIEYDHDEWRRVLPAKKNKLGIHLAILGLIGNYTS